MNALLLCAGLGTRLRPLTNHTPKPLLMVDDQRLLSRSIDAVLRAAPKKLFANGHHLFEQLESFVVEDGRIDRLFEEREILGTAAPLARVRDAGETDALLVVNGDLWHTIDLASFVGRARRTGADVVLLGRHNPEVNTLLLSNDQLVGIAGRYGAEQSEKRLTFTGVSWYSPEALQRIPADLFDVRQFWKSEWEAGRAPTVLDAGEVTWIDIGTPEGLQEAVEARRAEREALPAAQLSDCIRRWGVSCGANLERPLTPAGRAGSGRRYYRMECREHRTVVMVSPEVDSDFIRFIQIAHYLKQSGVAVPALYAIDQKGGQIAQQDFGAVPLHQLLLNSESRKAGFEAALRALLSFQRSTALFREEGPQLLLDRQFDFDALRWESDYFAEHYLGGVAGWSADQQRELQSEFDRLAQQVSRHPQQLMHRDFQSQNLMVIAGVNSNGTLNGGEIELGIIDFQGAREGSHWYDLASLLWDPYVGLSATEVRVWWERWLLLSQIEGEKTLLWQQFIEASLQRLMQACGAYGRLGKREGIPFFQQWIEPGAQQLARAMEQIGGEEYPKLRAAIGQIAPTNMG